jgi:hypothetical protein
MREYNVGSGTLLRPACFACGGDGRKNIVAIFLNGHKIVIAIFLQKKVTVSALRS